MICAAEVMRRIRAQCALCVPLRNVIPQKVTQPYLRPLNWPPVPVLLLLLQHEYPHLWEEEMNCRMTAAASQPTVAN